MKVLVHQMFIHASILEDMEWQASSYLRSDPDGTTTLEDGTMMGEWFDV